jgi:hypothetical protein
LKKLQRINSSEEMTINSQPIASELEIMIGDFIQLLKVLNQKAGL